MNFIFTNFIIIFLIAVLNQNSIYAKDKKNQNTTSTNISIGAATTAMAVNTKTIANSMVKKISIPITGDPTDKIMEINKYLGMNDTVWGTYQPNRLGIVYDNTKFIPNIQGIDKLRSDTFREYIKLLRASMPQEHPQTALDVWTANRDNLDNVLPELENKGIPVISKNIPAIKNYHSKLKSIYLIEKKISTTAELLRNKFPPTKPKPFKFINNTPPGAANFSTAISNIIPEKGNILTIKKITPSAAKAIPVLNKITAGLTGISLFNFYNAAKKGYHSNDELYSTTTPLEMVTEEDPVINEKPAQINR